MPNKNKKPRNRFADAVKLQVLHELDHGLTTYDDVLQTYGASKYEVKEWRKDLIIKFIEQGRDPSSLIRGLSPNGSSLNLLSKISHPTLPEEALVKCFMNLKNQIAAITSEIDSVLYSVQNKKKTKVPLKTHSIKAQVSRS